MASKFNEDKYKKIFESRYGAGTFDSGLSSARETGRLKAQASIARKDYLAALKKAQAEAKKQAEKAAEIYEETEKATPEQKENVKKNNPGSAGYAKKQLELMDPEAANAISVERAKEQRKAADKKESESTKKKKKRETDNPYVDKDTQFYYNQQNQLEDLYKRLEKFTTARDKKDRTAGEKFLNKNPRLAEEYTKMGGYKTFPTQKDYDEQKRIYNAQKNYKSKSEKKSKKEKEKKKERGGVLGFLDSTLGRASKSASELVFGKEFTDNQEKEYKKHTKNKQIKAMNKNISKKAETFTEKASDIAGKGIGILSYAIPGTAAESIASKGANLAKLSKAGSKAAERFAVKGTEKGLSRIAKQGSKYAAKGATAGFITGTGDAILKEAASPNEGTLADRLKMIGLETAGGAVLDPAIRGLGELGLRGLSKYAKGDVPTYTGKVGSSTLDNLRNTQTSSVKDSTDLYDRLSGIRKQPEVAAAAEKSIPESFEAITSRGNGGSLARLKAVEPSVNQTVDIPNPKELVKQQIDTKGTKVKNKWSFDKVMTALVDDLRPLEKATKQLGGKNLDSSKNPYMQARLARGVAGKAETYLKGGIYTPDGQKVGKSLQEIIKPVEGKMDDLLTYITSKRALDYDDKGLVAGIKPKNVEGITDRQLAEATIRQIEAESPELKAAQEGLVNYSHSLMEQLKDSGYYTEDALKRIFEENPNYVPMNRVQEPRVRGFQPLTNPSKKFASVTDPIKKRTGSTKQIINPIESLVKNTYVINNVAERNKVATSLLDLIEKAPEDNMWGRIVQVGKQDDSADGLTGLLDEAAEQFDREGNAEVVDKLFKGEGNKVYAYRNGEKVEMELQEDLYKAMLSLDAEKQNIFVKMLSVPTNMLRKGATLSPDFGPVNIFRDQFSALVNSKYGFKPFIDIFSGLGNVLKKDDVYWSWKNNGGANSVLSSLDREYLQNDLRTMVKQSFGEKAKYVVRHPLKTGLDSLSKLTEMSEEATRVGEFKKALKHGATPKEAAFASRDLIDFSRAGSKGRQFNQITAFFNAAVQSVDKMARTFKEDPIGASVRSALGITLPSVVAYVYNHDEDWYKELPQRDKDLYWHFKAGDQIYKLPKPFEAGILFGTAAERTLGALKEHDPEAFEGFGKTIVEAFTPNWIPTAVQPWIEVYGNKSMTFDSPIVPRREEDLLPEDQYGPYQSELAKSLGKLTKTSPRKIEHVFKGYTGGLGKYALGITDDLAESTGIERADLPDRGLADMPVVNRFVVKNLEGNNQSVNDFYERMDKIRRKAKSADKNNKSSSAEGLLKELNKLNRNISELQKQKREIIEDRKMGGKDKAAAIKELDKMITEIAKEGKSVR